MSKFLTCVIRGRMGNILCILHSLIGIAKKNNRMPFVDMRLYYNNPVSCGIIMDVMRQFNLEYLLNSNIDYTNCRNIKENNTWLLDEKLMNLPKKPDVIIIHGYLQTWKYNIDYVASPKEEYIVAAKKILPQTNKPIVGIHFRYPDEGAQMRLEKSVLYPYYKKAIESFDNKDVEFMLFAGGPEVHKTDGRTDNSLHYCRNMKSLTKHNFHFAPKNNSAVVDITALSLCDYVVVSIDTSYPHPNMCSTFASYATYLREKWNKNTLDKGGKDVIIPDKSLFRKDQDINDNILPLSTVIQ